MSRTLAPLAVIGEIQHGAPVPAIACAGFDGAGLGTVACAVSPVVHPSTLSGDAGVTFVELNLMTLHAGNGRGKNCCGGDPKGDGRDELLYYAGDDRPLSKLSFAN